MSYVTHADLGGREIHARAAPVAEAAGPFHAHWEARVHALTLAMGATGVWNLDMSRAARETLPDYSARSYYEIWLGGLERLLLARGLVTAAEIECGRPLVPARPVPRVLAAADVATVLAAGSPTARPEVTPARFRVGEPVRARRTAVAHHTRLPAYTRGRRGVVERVHGPHVFPDAHAQGLGEQPQWLYTVAFAGDELWDGRAREPGLTVTIDAWEPYLERA